MKNQQTWAQLLGYGSAVFRHVAKGGVIFEVGHDDRTSTIADMYTLILRPTDLTDEWAPIAVGYVNEGEEDKHRIVDCVGVGIYADDLDHLIKLLQHAKSYHEERVAGVKQ